MACASIAAIGSYFAGASGGVAVATGADLGIGVTATAAETAAAAGALGTSGAAIGAGSGAFLGANLGLGVGATAAETAAAASYLGGGAGAGAAGAGLLTKAGEAAAGSAVTAGAQALLTPTPPKPGQPATMPDPEAQAEARRKATIEQLARRGRAASILTENPSGKLGD